MWWDDDRQRDRVQLRRRVWNDGSAATGGGISVIFPLRPYQVDAGGAGR